MTTPVSAHRSVVGIFDSGVGGLTVVRSVRQHFPRADLVYLGDTARVPYGTKSATVVQRYAVNCARFLAEQGATHIVIACNTASAYGLETVRAELALPVTGVVTPGATLACERAPQGVIGVIATEGTIASGSYQAAIAAARPSARVIARACPLFVPLAEEGYGDSEAARLIAEDYLRPLVEAGVESVVLGCTHYPLLAPLIQRVLGESVILIDSGEAVTRVLDPAAGDGQWRFFATDVSERVRRVGRAFLGRDMPDVELVDL